MSWQFIVTKKLADISRLYEQVFQEHLDVAEFDRKVTGRPFHMFIVNKVGADEPGGFAIFIGDGQTATLWLAGIIPAQRHQGGGAFLVEQGEKEMLKEGYATIRVDSYNHWNIMLSILTRRGYRIVETDYDKHREDFKITLQRLLEPKRELRYALTERCNFNCLFCHNEGLGNSDRQIKDDDHILDILKASISAGYTDITFTGGEPTLKKSRLLFLIKQLGRMAVPPDITLVTNGSRLGDAIIKTLVDYPGNRKIHLSMHAVDEQSFQMITGRHQAGLFHRIHNNIRKAADAGLTVKMNHVVLRGINHHKAVDAIEFARSMGVSAIKFIELLVLPDHPELYSLYYDVNALKTQIASIVGPSLKKTARQCVYPHRHEARFTIELQQCTCALGCSHCQENRDRTFSSDLCYHPCFVRSRKYFRITDPVKLENILRTGDRIINGFAAKYRDKSPTLIQKEQYISDKIEYFYKLDDIEAFRSFLKKNGFGIKAISGFHEEYYRPVHASPAWINAQRILKMGWFHHDKSRINLVYSDQAYHYHPKLGLETVVRFLDPSGPYRFNKEEKARLFLEKLDHECFLELEWELETWEKGLNVVNLAETVGKATAKINGPEESAQKCYKILQGYGSGLSPLMIPLVQFIQNSIEAEKFPAGLS